MKNLKNLAEWLTELGQLGFTEKELAKMLDTSPSAIGAYRRGERTYIRSDRFLQAIARLRKTTVEQVIAWIYGEDTQPTQQVIAPDMPAEALLLVKIQVDIALNKLGYLPMENLPSMGNDGVWLKYAEAKVMSGLRELIFKCLGAAGFDIYSQDGVEQAIAAFIRAYPADEADGEKEKETLEKVALFLEGRYVDEDTMNTLIGGIAIAITNISGQEHSPAYLRKIKETPAEHDEGCNCSNNSDEDSSLHHSV